MRWAAIYEWATGQLSRRHDEDVTRFLLAQFVEFLDLTGLAPFIGFRAGDFDFFERPTWEKQPEVKTRLAALWDEMLELLPRERADLGKIHVGQLGLAETAHAQTNWREPGVNLTTELYANELQVNVVGWLQKDAARFEDWLISDRGRRRLNTLPGHQLIVYGRQAGNIAKRGQPGARPWFQREIVRELGCSSAPGADLGWIKGRMDELGDRKWEKAAFHLRRTWTKDEVLDKGKGIAREVADEVERLLPLVREINAATAS